MSRLCGLIAPAAPVALTAMLGGLGEAPGWSTTKRALGRGAVAWRGGGAARLCIDGPHMAVVDGYFYNKTELGGGNDVARLIALYRRHGFAEALARINGDFAVALYDAESGSLWLGRDRFGIKPLYYAETAQGLVFASEPQAILASGAVPVELVRQSRNELL
jgi:asparagine synthase (glutamine-hydrolysing)